MKTNITTKNQEKTILILIVFSLIYFSDNLLSQCPTGCGTVMIDMDALNSCGSGSTDFTYDISPSDCKVPDPDNPNKDLNCGEFIFTRSNTVFPQQISLNVGQGNGCNGELDLATVLIDGQCDVLSSGGSGTNTVFTFPSGISTISYFLCINSNAQVKICGTCKDELCSPNPSCFLDPILDFDNETCTAESPETDINEIFDFDGCATGTYSFSSYDSGTIDCSGPGGTITREYKLFYEDPFNGRIIEIYSCSQFITRQPSSFPIVLSSFNVDSKKLDAILSWNTESEIDNDKFVIQKSYDGKNFLDIDEVKGSGTSSQGVSYEYIDKNAGSFGHQKIYYRLEQIDYDGSANFSDTKMLNFRNETKVKIYPNPTSGNIYIDLIGGKSSTIKIYNTVGSLILNENYIQGGELSLSHLQSGLYYIEISDLNENKIAFEKILKN